VDSAGNNPSQRRLDSVARLDELLRRGCRLGQCGVLQIARLERGLERGWCLGGARLKLKKLFRQPTSTELATSTTTSSSSSGEWLRGQTSHQIVILTLAPCTLASAYISCRVLCWLGQRQHNTCSVLLDCVHQSRSIKPTRDWFQRPQTFPWDHSNHFICSLITSSYCDCELCRVGRCELIVR